MDLGVTCLVPSVTHLAPGVTRLTLGSAGQSRRHPSAPGVTCHAPSATCLILGVTYLAPHVTFLILVPPAWPTVSLCPLCQSVLNVPHKGPIPWCPPPGLGVSYPVPSVTHLVLV